MLAGHEHNFQLSEADGRTYVVSGAGAKLREEVPEGFADAHTKGWAAQAHLLVVDVDGDEARLTPIAGLLDDGRPHPMTLLSPRNEVLLPPFTVSAPPGSVRSLGRSVAVTSSDLDGSLLLTCDDADRVARP